MIRRLKLKTLDSIEFFRTGLNDHEYPTHYHDTFCISLIEKGTLCKNDLLATSKTILISHPQEVHKNKAFGDSFYAHLRISLSSDLIKFISKSQRTFFEEQLIYDETLFFALRDLSEQTFEKSPNKSFEKDLFRHLKTLIRNHSSKNSPEKTLIDPLIKDVKQHISKNLDSKIILEDLSKKFGMSKYKFIRWFKRKYWFNSL